MPTDDILCRCWFLAGPTASGKSDVALVLAQKLDAEVVSLDSMAIYRGMDIGTAKPTAEARAAVPHHLVDIVDPDQEFSLADYVSAAQCVSRDIVARGRTPLFVGGTGLYLRGMLRGVFEGPAADWALREKLEHELANESPGSAHQRLKQVDPQAALALHPNDTRRVIRALEVYHVSGRPLSEQQRQPALPPDQRPQNVFWLSPPRAWLYERINRRVESMFARGLIAEVQRLLTLKRPMSRTAGQALGYKETIEYLQGGGDPTGDLTQLVHTIQTRTRQFAKRQHTWFRNLQECRALEVDGTETPKQIAERLVVAAG